MRKMPTLYVRDWDGDRSRVTREVTPGCEWVLKSENERRDLDIWATRKFDGTCVKIDSEGFYWKRYDAKHGKTPPVGFVPAQPVPDPETGHWPGWLLVTAADKWHVDAMAVQDINALDRGEVRRYYDAGTYELCGPKISANPEQYEEHRLIRHGSQRYIGVPTDDFDDLKYWLSLHDIEGLVFYRNSGQPDADHQAGIPLHNMCKIKLSDFGLKREANR